MRAGAALGLAAAVALIALAAALWPHGDGDRPISPPHGVASGPPGAAGRPSESPASSPSPPREPSSLPAAENALSAALQEESVPLPSGIVVEGIDRDRPWVCPGESMSLSARVSGEREPGAVERWVWLTAGGGAELHPGPTLPWRAPAAAGSYQVRFQVCRDLGGRRVGVLAERAVEIEVRPCGEGEGQDHEPLRLGVVQRRHGAFAFHAVYQGSQRLSAYAWDFGDGTTATTTEPTVEHTYPVQGLDPHALKSFTVRLEARPAGGEPLEATTFALTRGQPPGDELPPVDLEISRWHPRDGGGFQSDLLVRNPAKADVTWEHLERVTQRWDGRVDIETRPWGDVIVVKEDLGHGGFRGHVTVSPSEASPDTKQILDFLHGHDVTGKEVVVSWSPFKRDAPPGPPEAVGGPPMNSP